MNYSATLNGHTLEHYEDEHLYLVDGVIVPSITQLMKKRFGDKYLGISKEVLERAAQKGTEVHEAIERYVVTGEETDLPEMRGFLFLQRIYDFEVINTERPVILFYQNQPIAAGRYDLMIEMDGKQGGADIKRTSVLDKEYLSLQLNLYRIAVRQTYGIDWDFLKGIHLRDGVRKLVNIPINEELTMDFIKEAIG